MKRKFFTLFVLTILCLFSLTAYAAFKPLGIYAIRNDLNDVSNPKLVNHLTLYNGQGSGYALYSAAYEDTKSYFKVEQVNPDYTKMSGEFTVILCPCNSSGKLINNTILMSVFTVSAKGSYGFYPKEHLYKIDGKNTTAVPVNPENKPAYTIYEPLYRTSIAHITAAKVSNGRVNTSVEYPNR